MIYEYDDNGCIYIKTQMKVEYVLEIFIVKEFFVYEALVCR